MLRSILIFMKGSKIYEEIERDIREYEYYNDSKVKLIKDYRGFLVGGSGYIRMEFLQ